jgi:hypothetical protein
MSGFNKNVRFLFLLIIGAFLLTAAAGAPADLPVEEVSAVSATDSSGIAVKTDDIPIPPRGCKTDCLISANINIKPTYKGETTTLTGSILIVDENGKPVSGAVVIVRWQLPDGTAFRDRVKTDSSGIAVVEIQAMQHGMFDLDVLRADKDGYRFDHNQGDCHGEFWM